MGVSIDKLVGKNGLIVGLSYAKAAKSRGAVLSISLGRKSANPLTTSLLLDGKDFHKVYAEAIRLISEYWGVDDNFETVSSLLATKDTFLRVKNLTVKEVCITYTQVLELA